MLLLLFETGAGRFALDTKQIVEIIPLLVPKKIPGAPEYVAGIINYRGEPVPVFDLCALSGEDPSSHFYSTRIVLVKYPLSVDEEKLIGLIAEKATDVVNCEEGDIRTSGILLDKSCSMKLTESDQEELVQLYDVQRMIPAETVRGLY